MTASTAAVLSIGTEITRGEIINTNASWLADELTRLGLDVTEVACVPDDRLAIQETLRRLGESHALVVSTGGLGPTTDDITSECVAALLGLPLERDTASLEAIRSRRARFGFGEAVPASNAKQADFPLGSRILANPHGTAPGFSASVGRATAFFMPGVPGEMKPMFTTHVAPHVHALAGRGGIHQVRLKTFGLPESTVNDRLLGVEAEHGVIIGYRAHFPEIEVKVLARRADAETAERAAETAAHEVRSRLRDVLFAEGNVTFAESVGSLLRARSLSFGTAESCTGGLVGALLTEPAGASEFFRGAIVSYDDSVKRELLGVPADTLARVGAVSAEVARAMAEGARRVLRTDVALAITGIAGPGGGTATKPVGLVHFAVSTAAGTTDDHFVFPSDRQRIRLRATYAGLALVRRIVETETKR
jgi:nicotinamide-nucleotide amidase